MRLIGSSQTFDVFDLHVTGVFIKYFFTAISNKRNHIHVTVLGLYRIVTGDGNDLSCQFHCVHFFTVNRSHINIRPDLYCVSSISIKFGLVWVGSTNMDGPMSISDVTEYTARIN